MPISDLFKGNTHVFKFIFLDNDNAPIDITNWSVLFTAKAREDDADNAAIIRTSATAGSDARDDVVNGIMHLTVTSTDTDKDPQSLHYDFKRVIPGNPPDIKTIEKSTFKILNIITISNS